MIAVFIIIYVYKRKGAKSLNIKALSSFFLVKSFLHENLAGMGGKLFFTEKLPNRGGGQGFFLFGQRPNFL